MQVKHNQAVGDFAIKGAVSPLALVILTWSFFVIICPCYFPSALAIALFKNFFAALISAGKILFCDNAAIAAFNASSSSAFLRCNSMTFFSNFGYSIDILIGIIPPIKQ